MTSAHFLLVKVHHMAVFEFNRVEMYTFIFGEILKKK